MEADDQIVQYEVLDWYQCYKEKWGDILQPESYDHPAKVAYGLAERIYKHLMEQGYLQPGDTVLVTGEMLDEIKRELTSAGIQFR